MHEAHSNSRALRRALPALAAATLLIAPAAARQGEPVLAVRAHELWMPDGQRLQDGVLLVEGAHIRAVGRGVEIPAGAAVIDHPGVVTAGLVALGCTVGLGGDVSEPKRSLLADGQVIDAFEAHDEDIAAMAREGITSFAIQPAPTTLCGGQAALVKSAHRTVVRDAAWLAISLSDAALDANRAPTSRSGAMVALEDLFNEAKGSAGLAKAARLPVVFSAPERDDVRRAIELAGRHKLRGAVRLAHLDEAQVPALQAAGLGAIVGAFGGGSDRRDLAAVVALGAAKVPLAFSLDAPARHPAALRLSAAMCVREGLDPVLAWNALTQGAAACGGAEDRIGRLERGFDADFVLWTGNPLDLASRPVSVFIDGQRVDQGDER